jgi:deoxyguanosine kinase
MDYVNSEKKEKPVYFIVEGNIGAGKSTFLRLLKETFNINIIYEPLDEWQMVGNGENILEKFYQDTSRWAYTFQTYAFLTRIAKQERMLDSTCVNVVERSVYSDRYCFAKNCFELGVMSGLEWELYKKWFEWLVDEYDVLPNGFIYLKTTPEVAFSRLRKRHREEEKVVALSYLTSINNKHEEWLVKKENVRPALVSIPVLIVDCNQDFENDPEVFAKIKEQISEFMKLPSLK